ncbi:MAG: hypothetical protein EOM77_01110 [Bacteroidia bacterium]|nr:hypothetical protein [Bacteroidia bacterium]
MLISDIQWKHNSTIISQRLNINYFTNTIAKSSYIIVRYNDAEYDDFRDGFLSYYVSTHDSCEEIDTQEVLITEFAVIIKDGQFTFSAHYSTNADYFLLEYFVSPTDEDKPFWDVDAIGIKYFSFDPSSVLSLIDYFID